MNSPSIILIRHCSATGQEPEAQLTLEGTAQANALVDLISEYFPKRIVSSPFTRAIESIRPLAESLSIGIEIEDRLKERELGTVADGDWRSALRHSFDELSLSLPNGESSLAAMERGRSAINDILRESLLPTVVVSHGNLISLIAKSFNAELGYVFWENLKNPDILLVSEDGAIMKIER
jgi:2,3-bisphosphoglycerate-dependent phosphoglycerate mutase